MFFTESLICQFVSWLFVATDCTWQQWVPPAAGCLVAFICRINSLGRLVSFAGGASAYLLVTIVSAWMIPLRTSEAQLGWFLFASLFLMPPALVVSLLGLVCGDLFRISRKQAGDTRAD